MTPNHPQPDDPFVHMTTQYKLSARREIESDTTEERPMLRLQSSQSIYALREDELNTPSEEDPEIRLEPMPRGIYDLLKSKEYSAVRTLLFAWLKTKIVLLINAGPGHIFSWRGGSIS